MKRARILIVDDSPTEMSLITATLAAQGYELITAVDGEDALVKATASHPDLIVMDVVMPKKNGFQVCRTLKNQPESRNIPVILLTGKSQPSDKFWGLRQGADEYLTKPFVPDTLLSTVQRFV